MQAASVTDRGGRQHNEDAVFCRAGDTDGCFVIADGLGGHGLGDLASQEAVRLAEEAYSCGTDGTEPEALIHTLHDTLRQMQQQRHLPHSMMTTAVIAQISGLSLRYAYVGDSRLYLLRNGGVEFCTRDHSVPQMLAACGEITEDEIRGHPDRNRLLQAAGMAEDVLRPGHGILTLLPGDALLLCSDGFWEPVCEQDMLCALAQAASPQQWLEQMRAQLVSRQTPDADNYSAIGVWIT